jgi:hypothetical protein
MGISGSISLVDPTRAAPLLRRCKTLKGLLRRLVAGVVDPGVEVLFHGDRPFLASLEMNLMDWARRSPSAADVSDLIRQGAPSALLPYGLARPGETMPSVGVASGPTMVDFLSAYGREQERLRDVMNDEALLELGYNRLGHKQIGDSIHFVLLAKRHAAEVLLLCRLALRELAEESPAAEPLTRDFRVREWLQRLAAIHITGEPALVEAGV